MEFVLFIMFAASVYAIPLIWRHPVYRFAYRLSLISSPFVGIALGYYFTFHFRFSTSNTQLYGFPCPQYAFQRAGAGEIWMDFPGPGPYIAFPFNTLTYFFVFILTVWLILGLQKRITNRRPNP